jgi:hypothetical protein
MTDIERASAIRGRTLRWTWTEGPTKGKTHEHVFRDDGTVSWREADAHRPQGAPFGAEAERVPYAALEVRPEVYAVSYRAGSGFTLTVVVDLASGKLVGFASNSDAWYPLRGRSERVS